MKREERRAATRQALAESAMRLFTAQGVEATTVEEIAHGAGVSARTFFLHFPSKASAVFPDHASNLQRFGEELSRLPDGGDDVADVCRLLVEGIRSQADSQFRRGRYGLVAGSEAIRELDARTDRDYEDAVAAHLVGRWGDDPAHRLAAQAVANVALAVARAALVAWGRDGLDPVATASRLYARLVRSPLAGAADDLRPAPAEHLPPRMGPGL
ncbi:MAG TPA: helix-turn-helix domain-containing protein [Kineosporiaceae bacterium]|nr:helix-turn-helix domain-containing protein [Kineosporiaceae bacterium]